MLKLQLLQRPTVPLEIDGITPDAVKTLSADDVSRLPIFHGRDRLSLGEFFSVAGDPADERLEWTGDLSDVYGLGAKMLSGEMHVVGSCGRRVGAEMHGGELHVIGDVDDWAGAEMRGGLLHVRGRAGHRLGGVYPGSRRGMRRGTILVEGDAGDEAGGNMRRGLIAIGGSAGEFLGRNMLAGTILVCGRCGGRPGLGMKRGTLGLLGGSAPLLPSFRRACRYSPAFMRLLAVHLQSLRFPKWNSAAESVVELHSGDLLEGGRGEILLRVA